MAEKNIPSSRQLLISFSGIDGAGKSTQIDLLQERLLQAGLRVTYLRFWDDVAALTSLRESAGHRVFKGEKGIGSPDAPVNRRDKNIRSPFMTLIRLGMYLLDAVSLRLKLSRTRSQDADIILCDRYIYDEIANLNLHHWWVRIYVKFLLLLAPAPDISFVIDADPSAARARKPEYPLDFLLENRSAYLHVSQLGGHFFVTPPASIEVVHAAICERVSQLWRAAAGGAQRLRLDPTHQSSEQNP